MNHTPKPYALPSLSYRPDLDGLRALAVLAVVAAHAKLPYLQGGFVGVDVFFVLSGYLITSIMARDIELGQFSFRTFYERRARRLLPALFFMLATVTLAGFWFYPPWQYDYLAKTMAATAVFSSNIQLMFATGDYFSAGAEAQPLLHTWSLAVEEQFYFLFPPLLLVAYRFRRKGAIALVATLCGASFIASAATVSSDPISAFFLPHLRAWEMGVGALLALAPLPKLKSPRFASAMGFLGLSSIVACILFYDKSTAFPGLAALPVVLGTAVLIHCGRTREAFSTQILSLNPVVGVGKISYSLYLWHWPPIVAAYTYTGGSPSVGLMTVVVGMSFVAAWVSWRFIEAPFRGSAERTGISERAIFRATAFGTSLVLLLAVGVSQTGGVASRLPQGTQEVFSAAKRMASLDQECRIADAASEKTFCRLGESDAEIEPSVFVWGDSHAGAWLPGVDAWLKAENRSGTALIKSGCPPLLGLERVGTTAGAKCREWNDTVISWIEESQVETIILSARWSISYHGTRVGHEPGDPVRVQFQGEDEDILIGLEAVDAALGKTLAALSATGKRVVVLGSIPEIGWHVPQRFLDGAFFERSADLEGPSPAEVARRLEPVDMLLRKHAERHDVDFHPVRKHFCANTCRIQDGDGLLYRDDDHLSELGALKIFPLVIGEQEG